LKYFRKIAIAEGWSYLLLIFLGMPLKYWGEWPEPNYVIGMAHGVLFVIYFIVALWVGLRLRWSWTTYLWTGIAAFLPFGTFVADVQLFRPMALRLGRR
jgi:integral membrane protein